MNKRSAEDCRKSILKATREVFQEHGYGNANMRLIARKAGISVGGLYLYFKNKEDLYQACTLDWMEHLNQRTDKALKQVESPVTALGTFIHVSLDFACRHREMITLMGREPGVAFASDLKKQFFRERRRRIEDLVRKGIEQGDFRQCDVGETSKVIFNILRGFIFSIVIEDDALFSVDECVHLVLNGLMRRTGE